MVTCDVIMAGMREVKIYNVVVVITLIVFVIIVVKYCMFMLSLFVIDF